MTGFLMMIFAIAGLVVAFEIGRIVHVQEKMGRCQVCSGTGRLVNLEALSGAGCPWCDGSGRADGTTVRAMTP